MEHFQFFRHITEETWKDDFAASEFSMATPSPTRTMIIVGIAACVNASDILDNIET